MKKFRLLTLAAAFLFFFAGVAVASEAPIEPQVATTCEDAQEVVDFAEPKNQVLFAAGGGGLDFLLGNGKPEIRFVCSSSNCPPSDPFCCGPNGCNDTCYAIGSACVANCNGNNACEQACAAEEVCCNCDCGALPSGVCNFFGC